LAILAAGLVLTYWTVHRADREMRDRLLLQARLVAQAVNVDRLRQFAGDETDLDRPVYVRLKAQLAAVKRAHAKCRFIYLMGRKPTGEVFFFVDNEPSDSKDCSPPGQMYQEAPDAIRRTFETGAGTVEGPFTDRWGTWVSAFAPITDPQTGHPAAVLGMDIAADAWARDALRSALAPVLLTLAPLVILLPLATLLTLQSRRAGARRHWTSRLKPAPAVAVALSLSMFAAWTAGQTERHVRERMFAQVTTSRADVIAKTFHGLRDTRIESLADFYAGSEEVSEDEFRRFTRHLTKDGTVHRWLWAPAVAETERAAFEANARAAGSKDYEIWQKDAQGTRVRASGRDTYYPIFYIAPLMDDEDLLGYDLVSDPVHRAALEEAMRADLPSATDAVARSPEPDGAKSVFLYRPVFDRDRPERLSGFAGAEVRMKTFLRNVGHDGATLSAISLVRDAGAPELLASDWSSAEAPPAEPSLACPVFAFGKVFWVDVRAGNEFLRLHPARAAESTALIGLLLSAALWFVLSMFFRRRTELERLVADRTASLHESEERYRMLFESADDSIRVMDGDRIVDCNARSVEMFGFESKEDVVGRSIFDFCPNQQPDGTPSRERALAMIAAALRGEPQQFQWRHLRKDGTPLDLEISLNRFPSQGKTYIQAIGRDITRRKQTEAELLRTQFAMDRAAYSILWVNEEGRLVYANDAACASMGYTRDELLAMTVFDIDPDFRIENWEQHKKDMRRLGSMSFESRHATKDGRIFPVEVTTNYFEFDGRFMACAFDHDISERKRGEEAIEKRIMALTQPLDDPQGVVIEDLFNLDDLQHLQDEFARATGVASLITRPDGTPVTKPSNFTRFCAETIRKSEIGRANCERSDAQLGVDGLAGPIIRPCLSAGLWGSGASITVGGRHIASWLIGQVRDETISEEHIRAYAQEVDADETDFLAAYHEVPVMTQEQFTEVAQVLFTLARQLSTLAYQNVQQARFITERKQAEEALREKAALLEAQVNATIDAILVVDEHHRRLLINQRAIELFHVPQHILENEDDTVLLQHVAAMVKDPELFLEKVNRLYSNIHEVCHDDIELGDGRLLDRHSAPVLGKDGKYYGRIWVFRDITESRRADEDREKLQAQLAQAQKMESVGRLAGGVAHDFNNMLGVILGHTELALEDLDPRQSLFADLHEIRKAAERSADLTRQLLAFARKQTISPKVLDLNETVEGTLKMLRRLIGEDIELAWRPGHNVGPVRIDPSQIDQILANLCVNARDAIGNTGTIAIETSSAIFDDAYCAQNLGFLPGHYALLAVSDNGCGMDKNMLKNLFEPFFTTKEIGKGTGLGLATVYGIVKQNSGFINVYSELGQGSTFRIYLPQYAQEAIPIPQESPVERLAQGRETILLVEDEPAILRLANTMLQRLGYAVIAASSPGEAMRLAAAHPTEIHLLMTDVVMPEMNGRDLAERLLPLHPDLKRLFMSGYTADVIAHHGVLDEGVHFIEKPFSIRDLGAKIRDVLDHG